MPPEASWHADYRDTAYIYIGGLPFDLSEGDILTIFSQFGEPVHLNLVRDKETGKSRGFAFLKYEDQRSTDLAVDNLTGSTVLGRVLRVDHVRYQRREEEGTADNLLTMEEEPVSRRSRSRSVSSRSSVESVDGAGKSHSKRASSRSERPRLSSKPLKEEDELREIVENHDDEDPMKDYLIERKKEEIEEASLRRDRDSGHRHHHRHHRHRDDDDHKEHRHEHRHRRSRDHHHDRRADREDHRSSHRHHRDRDGDRDDDRHGRSERHRDYDREREREHRHSSRHYDRDRDEKSRNRSRSP